MIEYLSTKNNETVWRTCGSMYQKSARSTHAISSSSADRVHTHKYRAQTLPNAQVETATLSFRMRLCTPFKICALGPALFLSAGSSYSYSCLNVQSHKIPLASRRSAPIWTFMRRKVDSETGQRTSLGADHECISQFQALSFALRPVLLASDLFQAQSIAKRRRY